MPTNRYLRRLLRAIHRQKQAAKKAAKKFTTRAGKKTHPPDPVIIHHQNPNLTQPTTHHPVTTLAEIEASADPQELSPLFNLLPLEIRHLIYLHLWRSHLRPHPPSTRSSQKSSPRSDLRLHVYTTIANTASSNPTSPSDPNLTANANQPIRRFVHLPCRLRPGAPPQPDVFNANPWPFEAEDSDAAPALMPYAPAFWWEAWGMRLQWERHWKCQREVLRRWDCARGEMSEDVDGKRSFGEVFRVCKRMYVEASISFFENVTLVFMTSLDARQFLVQRPNMLLKHLRHLEFCFCHSYDHLFLTKTLHNEAPAESDDDRRDAALPDIPAPESAADEAALISELTRYRNRVTGGRDSVCTQPRCSVDLFGEAFWLDLIKGLRTAAPNLRHLDVTIGGSIRHHKILDTFGMCEEGYADAVPGEEITHGEGSDVWELPGKAIVRFAPGQHGYVQRGRKVVRLESDDDHVVP
ncbi:hypothetical protein VTI74DRAFT_10961 [Chaetomium olivicolor]